MGAPGSVNPDERQLRSSPLPRHKTPLLTSRVGLVDGAGGGERQSLDREGTERSALTRGPTFGWC
jgi:hypothetical protein